jgi:hypothetical protein
MALVNSTPPLGATNVDERTLSNGDLQLGDRFAAGILNATVNGTEILIKDAANRKNGSLRSSVPDGTDVQREYATYLFAKMVPGLVEVPVMALRRLNGADVLCMEKVTGATHPGWDVPKSVSMTTRRNMALFDAIVGNTDRHSQNYFIRRNAKGKHDVIAIDHGLCFPIPFGTGRIDAGTSDFLRDEALPAWCIRWLNKVASMEKKIRATLSNYIELEALDGMFERVQWMLKRGTFMSRYSLSDYATYR